MKRLFLFFVAIFCAFTLSAAQPYGVAHGPYLQELTETGVTVAFVTSAPGFSCIELRSPDGSVSAHYTVRNGLRDAANTMNTVRLEGLSPATRYAYRIVTQEVLRFEPYDIRLGDTVRSPWYAFRTADPEAEGGSLFIVSDIHGDSAKLGRLLDRADWSTCTAFFYNGDMVNYMNDDTTMFRVVVDPSVHRFATSIPFEVVRGNHETRGDRARRFLELFPRQDDRIYGVFRRGDVMVVMLDCGEDKADTTRVYAGFNDFDAYRTEQAEWLARVVRTKEFRQARYRIVVCHIPTVPAARESYLDHGMRDLYRKMLPVLNRAKIDLMVSGHLHRFSYREPDEERLFPVVINSNRSATRLDLEANRIRVRTFDVDGQLLLDRVLE